MKIKLLMAFLFLNSVSAAQNVSTKGEYLDQVQVLALLAGHVPNARVATLVVERGVTFKPTNRYVQLIQKAGADDGVVTAIRVAERPPASPRAEGAASDNGPLQRDQILELLQTGVDSSVLAKLVTQRGINFEPFDEYLDAYQVAGAQENLLNALRQAAPAKPVTASATTAATAIAPKALPKSEEAKPAAARTGPKPLRVTGEKMATKLIFQPPPVYPDLAKMARIQGVVRLDAIIGQDGTIEDLKAISGSPLLLQSSMDAISKWKYQPTLLKGKPVAVETEIDVNFTLQQ